MQNKFLSRLIKEFEKLNKVPKFQLERAISPLLGIFIEEIINKDCDASVDHSQPEFPLKKRGSKQSTNIDWLLFDKNKKAIYCVELKTDPNSYDKEQNKIYKSVKKRIERSGATFLLKGLKTISKNSNRKPKYAAAIKKFNVPQKDLRYYKNFLIIYLAPNAPKNPAIYYDKLLLYRDLPSEIGNDLNPEWIELLEFLKTLSAQDEKK